MNKQRPEGEKQENENGKKQKTKPKHVSVEETDLYFSLLHWFLPYLLVIGANLEK